MASDLERLAERTGPIIPVALDAGTYAWLLEIIERKATLHQWVEPYRTLTNRALQQFRDAAEARPKLPTDAPKRVIPPVARGKRSR